MTYANIEDFKATAIETLQAYCNNYHIFKPTHYTFTTNLITAVKATKSKKELLYTLFCAYRNLLENTNSRTLFRSIAMLLSEELNIKKNELEDYLKRRGSEITLKKAMLFIPHEANSPAFFNSRCENDPIEIAVRKVLGNKIDSTETLELKDTKNDLPEYIGPRYNVTVDYARRLVL